MTTSAAPAMGASMSALDHSHAVAAVNVLVVAASVVAIDDRPGSCVTASPGPTLNVGVPAPARDLLRSTTTALVHRFHDSTDCPFAVRITRYDDSRLPTYPRRCNWCTDHDHPISS
jgi:hypothetical protein